MSREIDEKYIRNRKSINMGFPVDTDDDIKEKFKCIDELRIKGNYAQALDMVSQLYEDYVKDLDLNTVPLYFENEIEKKLYKIRNGEIDDKLLEVPVFQILYTLGALLIECDYPKRAEEILKKAWDIAPYNATAALEYIESLKTLGEWEKAEEAVSQALKFTIRPAQIAHLFRDLGFVFIEEGKLFEAAFFFNLSYTYEKNPTALMELAYIADLNDGEIPIGDQEELFSYLKDKDIHIAPQAFIAKDLQMSPDFSDEDE